MDLVNFYTGKQTNIDRWIVKKKMEIELNYTKIDNLAYLDIEYNKTVRLGERNIINSNELAQNTSIRIRHILHVSSFFSFGIDPAELDGIVDEDLKKEFIEAMNSEDLIFCAPMFSRPKSG